MSANTETKNVTTTIRLTGEAAERLRRVAERDDRSLSSVIRLALREYLTVANRN